jgi:hypothetical protein
MLFGKSIQSCGGKSFSEGTEYCRKRFQARNRYISAIGLPLGRTVFLRLPPLLIFALRVAFALWLHIYIAFASIAQRSFAMVWKSLGAIKKFVRPC